MIRRVPENDPRPETRRDSETCVLDEHDGCELSAFRPVVLLQSAAGRRRHKSETGRLVEDSSHPAKKTDGGPMSRSRSEGPSVHKDLCFVRQKLGHCRYVRCSRSQSTNLTEAVCTPLGSSSSVEHRTDVPEKAVPVQDGLVWSGLDTDVLFDVCRSSRYSSSGLVIPKRREEERLSDR